MAGTLKNLSKKKYLQLLLNAKSLKIIFMKKQTLLHLSLLLFLITVSTVRAQTNTIEAINKILNNCSDALCFSNKSMRPDGGEICCSNKRSLKYNEAKTELIFTQKHINSKNNKLVETFITKMKVKDIDFDEIKITGYGSNNEKSVILSTKENKKTFVTSCQGEACINAISYSDNIGINFGPDCVDENQHQKLVELLKKLSGK